MKTISAIGVCCVCAILIYSLSVNGQTTVNTMMRLQGLNGEANGTIVWNGTSDVRTLVHNTAGSALRTISVTQAGITHAGQLQVTINVLKDNLVTIYELNLVASVVGTTSVPIIPYQAPCLNSNDPEEFLAPIPNVAFTAKLVSTPVEVQGNSSKVIGLSCADASRLQKVINDVGADKLRLGLSICQTVDGDVSPDPTPELVRVSLGSSGAPLPSIIGFSPSSVTAGAAGFSLSANGSGFGAGAMMLWNGSERATESLSSSTLRASISAADVAAPGTVKVSVANPDCGRAIERNFIINPAPVITTSSELVVGAVGYAYSQTLTLTGGTAPFSWTVTGGALPDGLTLNQGIISGVPSRAGRFNFSVQLSDNSAVKTSKSFAVTINTAPVINAPAILPDGTIGVGYSYTIPATAGVAPYSWAVVNGALPNGLALNESTGTISGRPTGVGAFNFTVQLTDGASFKVTRPLTINIKYPLATGVSAASFRTDGIAMESTVAAFGQGLATGTETARTVPLPTTLAGTTVKVRVGGGNELLAPLFFVSSGQVNFQVPPGIGAGNATVIITSGAGTISEGPMPVNRVAPGLFSADATGQGLAAAVALRVKADNTQIYEAVIRFDQSQGRFVAVPIDLGPDQGANTDRVFLVLFGSGFRFRSSLSSAIVTVGGANSDVFFAGAHGSLTGVDQINALLPRTLIGRGDVEVVLRVEGKEANRVRVAIK